MNNYFAVTTPGLEVYTARELLELGFAPTIEPGGVVFQSDELGMYRANLHLRSANHVLARVGYFFFATSFAELRARAGKLPWERFLTPGGPVVFRVTCHHSKLIHTGAVAERIASAIADRLGKPPLVRKASEDDLNGSAQLLVVRVVDDQVQVSADTSGMPLHKRGYRQAVAKAPLRENLAAGILMASGWDRKSPLVDPFCGSGTIPIEAALMAKGIPPGINRRFAFMDWPGFKAQEWQNMLEEVPAVQAIMPIIQASDRDAGAIKMAQENAGRAGVAGMIEFTCQTVSAIQPPPQTGWVVTNPPYGFRVSEGKDLRNLYAQLGNVLRDRCQGWSLAVLSNDLILLGQIGFKLDTTLTLSNGGINVRLARGTVSK